MTYEEFFDVLFKKYELEIYKSSINNNQYQLHVIPSNQPEISDMIWLQKSKLSYMPYFFLPTDLNNALIVYFTSYPSIKLNAIRPDLVKLIKQEIGKQIAEYFDNKHDIVLYCGDVKIIEAKTLEEATIQLDLKDGIEV